LLLICIHIEWWLFDGPTDEEITGHMGLDDGGKSEAAGTGIDSSFRSRQSVCQSCLPDPDEAAWDCLQYLPQGNQLGQYACGTILQ